MKKLIGAAAVAVLWASPALAQDTGPRDFEIVENADKSGLRAEGRLFWERLNDPEEDIGINYELGSALGYGAEIGYDMRVSDNIVVGPYATYDFSNVEECEDNLCVASGDYYAFGLHVGFETGAEGLVYGKIGYGNQTVTLQGPYTDPETNETFVFDEEESGGGYNFAFGYEHGFGDVLYGRAELGVSESYDIYGFDFQRGYIGAALGARF
ncbi:hypothetical protein GRI38_08880 [Altererythrobacter aurantiacus]|uniref:Outer membrane protein beta-barrel domain-containing protein n=1 Tax=Parapontixanthobacter aurantiacus TaxID=1463599 RepID=A0A844ZC61_9SPHN|nr:porin family protein [Parapontixanthobacter aurantiacus]MXO86141.1 hypothetical protein [Parapontixanthobacter aurantiacus]